MLILILTLGGWVKPSSSATFPDLIKRFFEGIKKKCCELSLVNSELTNNKQSNYNNVNSQLTIHDSPFTTHKRPLSWIIASLGQVAHFTSVVIRNDNKVDSPLTTHNSLVKAIAFTLAETLVVMGIIGVVAALTIPNLNQSTGDREKVAKLKKVYANLEDAFGRATAVYGPVDEWFINLPENTSSNQRFTDRMTEFMKMSKDCGSEPKGCLSEEYKDLLDNTTYKMVEMGSDTAQRYFLSADGTGVLFQCFNGVVNWVECSVLVDLDGPKGSNTFGKDFLLMIDINELGQSYLLGSEEMNSDDYIRSCYESGFRCAYWIVRTGNMDYLKVDANGKCPNGNKLSFENPSCK